MTNDVSISYGPGSVAIYSGAQGFPTFYFDPNITRYNACGYDGAGNLFVSALNGNAYFAELPKNKSTFVDLTLPFTGIGGIDWDGKNLAIGSDAYWDSKVFRVHISGSNVRVVGSTTLGRGKARVRLAYFAISARRIIAAFQEGTGVWKYPQSGSMLKRVRFGGLGVALSVASH